MYVGYHGCSIFTETFLLAHKACIIQLITLVTFSKNVFVAGVDSYTFNLSPAEQYMHYALFIQSDEELNRLLTRIYRELCSLDDIYTLITKRGFLIYQEIAGFCFFANLFCSVWRQLDSVSWIRNNQLSNSVVLPIPFVWAPLQAKPPICLRGFICIF